MLPHAVMPFQGGYTDISLNYTKKFGRRHDFNNGSTLMRMEVYEGVASKDNIAIPLPNITLLFWN